MSTGAMVPVFDARDAGSASQIAELLGAHAIPAIVDSELAGLTGLAQAANPRVWVPSSMLPEAKAVLRELKKAAEQSQLEQAGVKTWSTWAPAQVVPTETPAQVYTEPPAAPLPEEPDLPLQAALPDSGPLAPRLALALLAIAAGLGFQRLFEMQLAVNGADGVRAAVQAFGASAAVLQEPWRLVSAGFMHGSFAHMASNGAFGLLIGVVLFGTHRVGATCFVWLLCSIVGIGAELLMSPNALVIGASAGNYGLMGLLAYGQLQRANESALPRRERLRTYGVLLLLVPGAMTPFSATGTKIAVVAHGVGFLVGFLSARFFVRRLAPEGFDRIKERSQMAGFSMLACVVAAMSVAVLDTLS